MKVVGRDIVGVEQDDEDKDEKTELHFKGIFELWFFDLFLVEHVHQLHLGDEILEEYFDDCHHGKKEALY